MLYSLPVIKVESGVCSVLQTLFRGEFCLYCRLCVICVTMCVSGTSHPILWSETAAIELFAFSPFENRRNLRNLSVSTHQKKMNKNINNTTKDKKEISDISSIFTLLASRS